jgi:hypothetical protein
MVSSPRPRDMEHADCKYDQVRKADLWQINGTIRSRKKANDLCLQQYTFYFYFHRSNKRVAFIRVCLLHLHLSISAMSKLYINTLNAILNTKMQTEQNWKLSTGSWNITCPHQLWSPRRCSNHLLYQLPTIDQESKSSMYESTWKSTFYQPLLSSGASKEIPTKTNVMPNTNIIILSVSNTWQWRNRILSF